jgi:hypothetical protein
VAVVLAAIVTAPACAADQRIQLLSSQRLDSRLTELTLSTPALRHRSSQAVPAILSTLSGPTG